MQRSGKVVVITRAGSGIGRAIALAFAARSAEIAALDRASASLDETCAQCEAKGVRARPYVIDEVAESRVVKTLDAVIADLRRPDVLANDARIKRDALLVMAQDGR